MWQSILFVRIQRRQVCLLKLALAALAVCPEPATEQ